MKWINQYSMTHKLAKEVFEKQWNWKLRYYYIFIFIAMIMFLFQFLVERKWMYIFLLVLCILSVLLIKRYKKIQVIHMWKRMKKELKKSTSYMKIELSDAIYVESFLKEKKYSWQEYLGYFQTEHMLYLIVNREAFIALKKDTFVKGTLEECITYLNTKKPEEPLKIV